MALLHSLTLGLIFLPRERGDKLIALTREPFLRGEAESILGGSIDELLNLGLLVENLDQDESVLKRIQTLIGRVNLDLCYLLLADGCNLQCRYCFEDTPEVLSFKAKLMDDNVISAGLETFARLTLLYGSPETEQRVIHLYGGEPLLNMQGVRAAVLKIEDLKQEHRLPSHTDVVIVTNGVLLNRDMARFLSSHQVTIGISLDGPQHIHDKYRTTRVGGKGTFTEAVAAYQLARDCGARVGISATLTPDAVRSFDGVLEYFVNELGIQDGISFNILHFNHRVPVGESYYQTAAQCILKAFEVFRNKGIYEERMMRKAQSFVECEPIIADCGVNGSQIVIAPDGSIGVCQDFVKSRTYFRGTVLDPLCDPVQDGLFDGWVNRSPFFMDECLDCEAIGICGGGCPASAELKTGSRWNIDHRICPHSKLSLEWLIWQTYSATIDS